MDRNSLEIINGVLSRNIDIEYLKPVIIEAIEAIILSVENKGKILICGNGGSASDSEHIVGELLKEFYIKRPIGDEMRAALIDSYKEEGEFIAEKLQGAIPAISLSAHTAFLTAFSNDVEDSLAFAQQVHGYGEKGDILICLSTSGNSKNTVYAAKVARVKGMKVISFTGKAGSELKDISDYLINAPAVETYRVQEYHLIIYHLICRIIEQEIFAKEV